MSINTLRTTLIPLLKLSDGLMETVLETMDTLDRSNDTVVPADHKYAMMAGLGLNEVPCNNKTIAVWTPEYSRLQY